MTDSNDDGKKGRPRGRPSPTRPTSGDKPFRKPREGGAPPFRARTDEADRPRRDSRDKPFRAERPFRARPSDDRPRENGDNPFNTPEADAKPWAPREGGDRFARPTRPASERSFGAKRPEGDRPFKSRAPFKPRDEGAGRPERTRSDSGERPFRARRPDSDRGPSSRAPRPEPKAAERPRSAREVQLAAQALEPVEDRIAKVIARAGIASRRDVEAMIAEGRVTLNGKVLDSPAINVTPADQITVDGEPLPTKERTRLWLYHKPRGLVTTARDPEGRPTVFDNLPEDLPRVVAIGRLDINTEGLLLLTNDGGLARVIAHPDTGWLRRYKVRAHGEVNQAQLDNLRDGITIEGMEYGSIEARLDRVQGDNAWISLGLREGKNREVKRILEHLGLRVNRLIRLSFGPFQLGELEEGMAEEVKTKILRDQLGDALALEAGVDFESPVREPIAPFGAPPKEDRPERGEDRRERPARASRDDDRPRRPRSDSDRPMRGRDEARPGREDRGREERGRGREEEAPRKFPSRLENKTSIWRANQDDETGTKKVPRRGADPHAARTASAERPRERAAPIETGEGRKVRVERLVSQPKDETPTRAARREGFKAAPAGEDRPRRRNDREASAPRRESDSGFRPSPRRDDDRPARPSADRPFRARPEGDRPFRARSDGADRPRGPRTPRPEGDRPFRPRPEGDRPFRARSDENERPRGPRPPRPEGDRPFRPRPEGDDRARKPQGDRPFRARSDDGERPRSPRPQRPDGDRPFRSRDGDKPFRPAGDDQPRRGPPRSDGPPRGGPKSGPGGGFKSGPRSGPGARGAPRGGPKSGPGGGFKGGPRGGPKGRRP